MGGPPLAEKICLVVFGRFPKTVDKYYFSDFVQNWWDPHPTPLSNPPPFTRGDPLYNNLQ